MRFFKRGQRNLILIFVCCIIGVLGLIQLNSIMDTKHINYYINNGTYDRIHFMMNNLSSVPLIHKRQQSNLTSFIRLVTKSTHTDILSHHSKEKSGSTNFELNFNVEASLQYGHFRAMKGFLTIGISSVKRERYSYLRDTIDSLLENISPLDKKTVTIVIMFSDDDQDWNDKQAKNMSLTYEQSVTSGHIQIITLRPQNYPDFSLLPRTYNDSLERLKWRSKQNIHYAFLFRYCYNISEYYLHLEDDVQTAKNFISDIRSYKRIAAHDWFMIRFSNMGFIGVFYRSCDLLTVSEFLLLFYSVQPCDYLMQIISKIKLQKKEIRYSQSLFQHHGLISSLKNKRQVIVDTSFKEGKIIRRKKYYILNPPAKVTTTMEVYEDYTALSAYELTEKYFWAVSPKDGQTYTIALKKPQNLTGILLVGGYPKKKNDIIISGRVQVSSTEQCTKWYTIGSLSSGSFNTESLPNKRSVLNLLLNITCVRIEITKSQNNWAIISEIGLLQGQQINMKKSDRFSIFYIKNMKK